MANYYNLDDLKAIATKNPGGYFTGKCVAVWTGLSLGAYGYPSVQSLSTENGIMVRAVGKTPFRMMTVERSYKDGDVYTSKEVRYNRYRPVDGGYPVDGIWVHSPLRIFEYLRAVGATDDKEYEELELFIKAYTSREMAMEDFRSLMGHWRTCKNFDHHYDYIDGSSWSWHHERHKALTQAALGDPVIKVMMAHHKIGMLK